jgi:hypothetical protein
MAYLLSKGQTETEGQMPKRRFDDVTEYADLIRRLKELAEAEPGELRN